MAAQKENGTNGEAFGTLLARSRRALGLTQHELALKCATLGYPMSASSISELERGRRKDPRSSTIAVLEKALGTSLREGDGPAIDDAVVAASLDRFLKSELAKTMRITSKEVGRLRSLRWFAQDTSPDDWAWADFIRLHRRIMKNFSD